MGDGAEWIWNLADEHFPGAIQIADLYHARQHLWEVARRLYPHDEGKPRAWDQGPPEASAGQGKNRKTRGRLALEPEHPEAADPMHPEADYFERNAERMRYPQFRRQHLFVSSGVIEAGCKRVIASRRKRSGMFWTLPGANAIVVLRCSHLNGRFEDYWEGRRVA